MSLFRKPNRKFRQRLQHSDTEDEAEATNVPVEKSPPRVETPAAPAVEVEDPKAPASLLSFGDDDEEETEVFKVRKSTYSRRLAKQLERDRKKKLREATKVEVKPEPEPLPSALPEKPSVRPFSDELEIKIKNTFKILNSEEIKGSESEEENEGEGPQYRRLRNVIQSGVIPDAATIYALKKRRQMAREMGDFIPLEQPEDQKGGGEDDDQSEDEEGRINFTVNTAALEKQRAREALIQAQEEQSGDEVAREDVAELERWEQEQMKKGVSTAPVAAVSTPEEQCVVPTYFTEQPTAVSVQDRQNLSSQAVLERITDRLATVREMLAVHRRQKTQALTDLEVSAETTTQLHQEQPKLETNFRFFQEMQSYAADLIECLDAKTPVILALEGRMMSLLCQRSEKLVQRRHQDIKDQAEECNIAVKAMRGQPVEANNRGSQQRSWRAAEREGRRVRRRKAREAKHQGLAQPRNLVHHDGMSTDDEQPDADRLSFDKERELILDDARHVFEDVTEQFSSVAALKQKFERWKRDFGESYEQAYIPLCLVKLLVSFVRLQMVALNPIELMKNVLSWQGLLVEEPLKELSLCSLLSRYLIVALQAGLSQRDTVEKCTRLVSTLPTPWLRGSQLSQLEFLTRFLRLYLQHLEGVSGSSNLGPDMHARNALEEVGKLLASLTDKTK